MRFLYIIGALLFCFVLVNAVPKCSDSMTVGDKCHIKAARVRPTQFGYGRLASLCKKEYIESMSTSELQSYLAKYVIYRHFDSPTREKNTLPLILGPAGTFYTTDHHHLLAAILASSIDPDLQVLNGVIIADLSSYNYGTFWSTMVEKAYVWLFDEKGAQPLSPFHLASDMTGLQNDFYRSLAYFVRESGGFGKSNTSYSEFLWANWFRANLPISNKTVSSEESDSLGFPNAWNLCDVTPYEYPCLKNETGQLFQMINSAISLAKSPLASKLPGWMAGQPSKIHCTLPYLMKQEELLLSSNAEHHVSKKTGASKKFKHKSSFKN